MPNNSFKPKLLRYTNGMAGKACHAIGSTTQFGLTQALALTSTMSTDLFSMEHFLDKNTGKVHRRYFFKRRPCQSLVLTSKRAKQLAGYTLIEKDLRSCLAWLDEIDARHTEGPTDKQQRHSHSEDRATYTLIKGLFVALLTFYAKCFTRCEGRRVKLDKKQLDPEFHAIHDHCMTLRHNFAAHSGAELIEKARVVAVYRKPKNGKLYVKVARELEQPDLIATTSDEISIRQLLGHARGIALAKIEELAAVIQDDEAPEAIMQAIAAGKG